MPYYGYIGYWISDSALHHEYLRLYTVIGVRVEGTHFLCLMNELIENVLEKLV